MASQYNTTKTSAERATGPILSQYLCHVCRHWKDPSHYSNRELFKVKNRRASGNAHTGASAKLRCRVCTGGSINEKRCEGPCGKTKSLAEFSKTSRSAGGNQMCKLCTVWKEETDIDIAPPAPPTSTDEEEPSPDERDGWHPIPADIIPIDDPEAGNDDYDDDGFGASSVGGSWGAVDDAPRSSVGGSVASTDAFNAFNSQMSNMNVSGSWGAARHTLVQSRSHNPSRSTSSSSVSNPYASTDRNPAVNDISYNAWDNTGRCHQQQRVPSNSEQSKSQASSVASSCSVASTGSVATVRAAGTANATQYSQSRSDWAKPVVIRSGPAAPRPSNAPKHATNSIDDEDYM